MEEQTIVAKGKPTLKNAWQFLIYSVGLVLLVFILVIYVLVTIYYTTTMYGDQRAILLLSLQKAIIPTFLLFFLYFSVLIIREYRVLKKRGIQRDETIFIISKEGIYEQKGRSKERISWTDVVKIKEYKELFLFRHSSIKWSFIPKHMFQTEEDLRLFKKMIQEFHTDQPAENNHQPNLSTYDSRLFNEDTLDSSIVAKGNFTFEEYDQYASISRNKGILFYIVAVLVLSGLISRDIFFNPSAEWDFSTWLLLLICLMMIALGALALYLLVKRRTRKEYKSDPITQKEKGYVVNEEGITYIIGGSFTQYQWKDFRKVREYKSMLLFYILPQRALLLPFRVFETPEDVEKVKELIQKNVDPKDITFEK